MQHKFLVTFQILCVLIVILFGAVIGLSVITGLTHLLFLLMGLYD